MPPICPMSMYPSGISKTDAGTLLSLADKLDSVVGMFTAGERPTGSRDPLGLRRQAQGIVKVLADLPEVTGLGVRIPLGSLLSLAAEPFGGYQESEAPLFAFMAERLTYLLEQRGFDVRAVRAVMHGGVERVSPIDALRKTRVPVLIFHGTEDKVVPIEHSRDLAAAAVRAGTALPRAYHRLFWTWFAFGFPAFAAVLGILWLMTSRPVFSFYS